MNSKIIIAVISAIVISSSIIAFSVIENNTQNISESTKNSIYIPSDITKANPNILVGSGEGSWTTTNIEDVKDQVIFTIKGTVLSVDNPIDWKSGVFHEYVEEDGQRIQEEQIHGYIPITISIEDVYKGNLTDETFTFYVQSFKFDGQYSVFSDSPNFEIGEKVLVHLAYYDKGPFPDGHYYVKLSQFGKYQLNEDDVAFNVHQPNGIPINIVAGKSLP